MALFEAYERRIDQINAVLNSYGISSIEEAEKITKDAGLDVYDQVKKIQPICFENACWAYTVGAAIAIKKGCRRAADAAAAIGEGLQAFCIPGSVADHRKVGLGHGNLGKMLLEEETECFCFLAGHESFAAAEGAIGIAEKANKVRQKPLRVILNGLGKDAAQIISRINGFTFVETQYDYKAAKLNIVSEHAYSDGLRATVKCYGADDVQEGVAIMHHENVGVSITGNSTNPTRFQINDDRKVTFRYFDWTASGGKSYRREGALYETNPVALCVDRHYYLVAYDPAIQDYRHYRVDRMEKLTVSDRPRDPLPADFDLGKYVRRIFDMYNGRTETVRLRFDRALINVVMDRFGADGHIHPDGERIAVTAPVEVGPTFYGWLFQFGAQAEIVSPDAVRRDFARHCQAALSAYPDA